MIFVIKTEVGDARAKTFAFNAQMRRRRSSANSSSAVDSMLG